MTKTKVAHFYLGHSVHTHLTIVITVDNSFMVTLNSSSISPR